MEVISLVDMWEKSAQLDRETIGQVFRETMTLNELIEYMLHHHYDFSVFYDGDESHSSTLYADYGEFEYKFQFDGDDLLIDKSRHRYVNC